MKTRIRYQYISSPALTLALSFIANFEAFSVFSWIGEPRVYPNTGLSSELQSLDSKPWQNEETLPARSKEEYLLDFLDNEAGKVEDIFPFGGLNIRGRDIDHISKIPKKLCAGLAQFHRVYGSTEIPSTFVIPSGREWPMWLRGFQLGRAFALFLGNNANIGRISVAANVPPFKIIARSDPIIANTSRSDDSTVVAAISKASPRKYSKYNFSSFSTAISIYKAIHNGSLVIPKNWKVPSSEPWPRDCWNMKLGVFWSIFLKDNSL